MMDFVLQRAKAFAAAFGIGLVTLFIKSFESASGFDIPSSWETWGLAAVTALLGGLIVHNTPNKSVSQ